MKTKTQKAVTQLNFLLEEPVSDALADARQLVSELRTFDSKPFLKVEEAIPTQLLWWVFTRLGGVWDHLQLRFPDGITPKVLDEARWSKGRHRCGDLSARTTRQNDDVIAHVELKSKTAAFNTSKKTGISQLSSMAADPRALVLVVTHRERIDWVHRSAADLELSPDRVQVISFSDIAHAIEAVLNAGGTPSVPLLSFLLDTEPAEED